MPTLLIHLLAPLAQVAPVLEEAADIQSTGPGMTEPYTTAVLLTVLGILIAFSVIFSRTADRAGVPIVLLFLVIGVLGGSEGIGGYDFDDY